jgi:hypothetical protein
LPNYGRLFAAMLATPFGIGMKENTLLTLINRVKKQQYIQSLFLLLQKSPMAKKKKSSQTPELSL